MRNLLEHFWKRWREEYLLELRNAHRTKSSNNGSETIHERDVVIIHEDNKKRSLWKLGRVKKLIKGRDGATRGAVVQTCSSKGARSILKRPVQKLYPLEVSGREGQGTPELGDAQTTVAEEDDAALETTTRPRRAAAQRAEEQRRLLIRQDRV